MRLLYILILVVFPFYSFSQTVVKNFESNSFEQNELEISKISYMGKFYVDTVFDSNNQIQSIGNYAIAPDSTFTDVVVNHWIFYYPNGNKKAEGYYSLDFIPRCAVWQTLIQYRPFKSGYWKYYYENGKLRAEGKYKIKNLPIEPWEPGMRIRRKAYSFHVTNQWKFYDENSERIKATKSLKTEFEQ